MKIWHQDEYLQFIISQGVGVNDKVASSPASYLSYLSSVSHHLSIEISPITLNCENDVQRLAMELEGKRKPRTIGNYISAMRQYVAMVDAHGIRTTAIVNLDSSEIERSTLPQIQEDELVHDDISDDESADDKHFLHSSFREKLLEHLLVAELLKRNWLEHSCDLEIAKPEVDSKGYDLIAEKGGIVRHIQLKSTKRGGNASSQNIHIALAAKPSGCVIWLEFDEHSLELGPFRFLGASPGEKLPKIDHFPVAKHTKANAEGKKSERPQLRRVSKSQFDVIYSIDELYEVLFG